MQDLMRKHKTLILVFIIIFIGVPFVFMGYFNFGGGDSGVARGERVVATVGGVPIKEWQFLQGLDNAAENMQQRSRAPEKMSYEEMARQGIADKVLEQLMDGVLLNLQELDRPFELTTDYLQEELKKDPTFQDANGEFDTRIWNNWVSQNKGMDWNQFYDSLEEQMSREVFAKQLLARSGRVFEDEIEEQLIGDHTKIKVKYALISPQAQASEEEVKAFYEANKEQYRGPDSLEADYVKISLQADKPALVDTLHERVKQGEAIEALAKEFEAEGVYAPTKSWLTPAAANTPHIKAILALPVGGVSDPVYTTNAYAIYKVVAERTNEENQQREVQVEQLVVPAALDEAARAEREDKAYEILSKATELDDLKAAAKEFSMPVNSTGSFSRNTRNLPAMPKSDVFSFIKQLDELPEDQTMAVIQAPESIYVAKVTSRTEGTIPAFEVVKDTVTQGKLDEIRRSEEFLDRADTLADKIMAEATSLADAREKFPELNLEIKETPPITRVEPRYLSDIFLETAKIYDAVEDKAPGELAGALMGFVGGPYLIELVEKIPPTEEDMKTWDEKRKELREERKTYAMNNLYLDYCKHLRDRSPEAVEIHREVMNDVLGVGKDQEAAAADEETAGDEAADAVAAEEAAEEEVAAEEEAPAE